MILRYLLTLAAACTAAGGLGWVIRRWLFGAIDDAFDFDLDAPAAITDLARWRAEERLGLTVLPPHAFLGTYTGGIS